MIKPSLKSSFLIGIGLLVIIFFLFAWAGVDIMLNKAQVTDMPCDCISIVDGKNLCAQFSTYLLLAFLSLSGAVFFSIKIGKL